MNRHKKYWLKKLRAKFKEAGLKKKDWNIERIWDCYEEGLTLSDTIAVLKEV